MLVTWRYRKRKSLIQSFDPRAWIIFYGCFLASTLLFWDLRVLSFFLAIALLVVFTSGIQWHEMARAWIFIGGFIIFFSFLTFLTGRGGMELYTQEHLIASLKAPFTIFGWRPALDITIERTFYALSMLVRVFSIASMTILIPYSLNPIQYGITFELDDFEKGNEINSTIITPGFEKIWGQNAEPEKTCLAIQKDVERYLSGQR